MLLRRLSGMPPATGEGADAAGGGKVAEGGGVLNAGARTLVDGGDADDADMAENEYEPIIAGTNVDDGEENAPTTGDEEPLPVPEFCATNSGRFTGSTHDADPDR